jgi:hypothetical protein
MEKEILKNIVDELNVSLKEKGKFIKLSLDDYNPVEISKEHFHEIEDVSYGNKIAFVDGGNAEILKAANFSLQLIRVYYTFYKDNKRIKNKRYEFYILVKSFEKDGKILYKTKTFGDKILNDLEFDSFDRTITQGVNRADVSFIGNVARRFAELHAASEIMVELGKNDVIVLDGSLETKYTYETKILNELHDKSDRAGVVLCGFSKTCELLTDKGVSFAGVLSDIQPEGSWYYYPAAKMNDFEIVFVKLNQKSGYIFRLDVNKKEKIDVVLRLLKNNSNDPVFLGYPYGLVEADRFARVSNRELGILKTKIMAKAGKEWKNINNILKTKDSHSVLDNIG